MPTFMNKELRYSLLLRLFEVMARCICSGMRRIDRLGEFCVIWMYCGGSEISSSHTNVCEIAGFVY